MKRSTVRFSVVTAAVLFIVGCATVGDIPVDIQMNDTIYISPANGDGVQDEVSISLSVIPLERTRLARYAIIITDIDGNVVRSEEGSAPAPRLFRRNRTPELLPPDFVLWDGRDADGALVADGEYALIVQVWDSNENTGTAPAQRIVVDNQPPVAEVSMPFNLFTPNDDGRLDVISIYQRNSSVEDRWTGTIAASSGGPVRSLSWAGAAADFTWDGKTDSGGNAPEGSYGYVLEATDRAGNTARFTLTGIDLERDARPVRLTLSRRAFSPNGDGMADVLTLTPEATVERNIQRWAVEIRDIGGRPVRRFDSTGPLSPINFDGTDSNGNTLRDDQYIAVLTTEYAGGQNPRTASPVFVVDNQPPRAAVRTSTVVFSPDGDGLKDTVEVSQVTTSEGTWTGRLEREDGTVVRTQEWQGQASGFVWDGTDAAGGILPDGTYVYRLSTTDAAENQSDPAVVRIRLDTRPVPVRIEAGSNEFSPNGDGIRDSVVLSTSATVPDGIARWIVSVRSSQVRDTEIASGTGPLPGVVQWDGMLGGRRAADGSYTARLQVTYEKGNVSAGNSSAVRLDTTGPRVTVGHSPTLFSPDDDGTDDLLTIRIETTDASAINRWEARILDPTGQVFRTWSGSGTPPRTISWDGHSAQGELVQSAEDYTVQVTAVDSVWNSGNGSDTVPIDILVIREGDRLRIRISSIYFVPFTADYVHLDDPEQAAKNLQTLDRLAVVLKKYPDRQIRIEGHAVSLYWYDQVRAAREQREVLVPLSIARAEAIKTALVQRGIVATRMDTAGYGGSVPIVPHGDETNRWKNRRVEFILERR